MVDNNKILHKFIEWKEASKRLEIPAQNEQFHYSGIIWIASSQFWNSFDTI